MKIRLTQDITKYDEKMKLRFDLSTLKKIAASILTAVAVYIVALIPVGPVHAITVALIIGFTLFMLLASQIDGKSGLQYIFAFFMQFVVNTEARKPHGLDDTIGAGGYRISIKEDKNEVSEKEKDGRKKGAR